MSQKTNRQNQAIELHVANSNELRVENESVSLEIMNDDGGKTNIPINNTPIKHAKCMMILYIIFVLLNITSIIIQFGEFIDIEVNLMLITNLCGGTLLILWIIYEFYDTSLITCFRKRDLYLPLLFHVMDTSSDLATIYIYFDEYRATKQELTEESDGDTDTAANAEEASEATTNLQLFVCSIFIIISYRIVSSLIVYIYTNKKKDCCLQFCDVYIYEILIKSWQYNKTKATLLQSYIASLEAYFESFPQLILNILYITEVIVSTTGTVDNEYSEINKVALTFIIISGLLSIISVASKARKSDERYFRADANIRDISNKHKFGPCKCCCISWKYIIHLLYRYCDVWYRVYALNILWYHGAGGFFIVGIILFDFFGALLVSSIQHKSINFELISCIAITPIVSSRQLSIICVFIYKIVQNFVFLCLMIKFTNYHKQLFEANVEIYNESDDELEVITAERDPELFPFITATIIIYIFITIISFIYFFEGVFNKRCCCNVVKKYGSNTRTFEGIESVQELQELIQFGYRLNEPNNIKKGNFITMRNIKNVYKMVINNINDEKLKKEFITSWKHIHNLHRGGSLLHQYCQNINDDNDMNETLNFIINDLEYNVNEKYDAMTPLMIAAIYQRNDKMIKLLINEYNADIDIYTDNHSALYYVHKYNKSKGKHDMIEFLKNAMDKTRDNDGKTTMGENKENDDEIFITPLPGQCLIERTGDLQKDLMKLKERYPDKYEELLHRSWIRNVDIDDIDIDDDNLLSIMQFNMLADGLCGAYSNKITEKTFVGVNKECLLWTYRGLRICEEIIRYKPDIIGIEECDQLSFIMEYLKQYEYKCYFQIKNTSPISKIAKALSEEHSIDINMALDGVALIFNSNKFEIDDIQYIDCDNNEKVFGLGLVLKQISNNKQFLCIVTHLKSTKTEKGEELRERQINLLLKHLIKNDKNVPIILCCDLNANPIQNKNGYDPLCYESITNCNNLGFESVYKIINGSEPEYTTWKYRENGTEKHVLDYIFIKHNNIWNVDSILDIPKPSILDKSNNIKSLIPNWNYPSDHFSIITKLTWK